MKVLHYLLPVFCFFIFSQQAKGQLNASYVQGSCDSVTYWYDWAGKTNFKTNIYWGDGTSTKDSVIAATYIQRVGYSHKYAAHGYYTITSVLRFHDGTIIDSSSTNYSTYCSFVNINGYIDNNANCVRNVNEPLLNAPISVEVDSAGSIIDTLSIMGSLYYSTFPGSIYKFKPVNLPEGTSVSCPTGGVITVTAPPINSTIDAGFALQCNSSNQYDLGVTLSGAFRPVATSRLTIHAYNYGCNNQNGTVTLFLSNKYVYRSASLPPTSVSGNTITWNVSNLSINNKYTIYINAETVVGANLQVNDTICNTVTITPTSGDVNTANNNLTQCDKVRAAFDPNDKQVFPSGDIASGTKLTYTINFENLGNDTAFNIFIMDTLSNTLDAGSFQILNSSHAVTYFMYDGTGGQKIIRFDFKDIHLPDKNTPAHNKGFIRFSINAKTALAPLTQINNRAGIYFDINPVVLTNYAENRIASPENVGSIIANTSLTIYPNPVTDVLSIKLEKGDYESLKLINNIGQVIMQKQLTGFTTQIDMKQLPAGLYYLLASGKEGSISLKVEKL